MKDKENPCDPYAQVHPRPFPDRVPETRAADIARIIRGAPEGEMNSGQILLLLNQAWDAGQRAGFAQGHLAGQTHAIAVQDLVRQSMQR